VRRGEILGIGGLQDSGASDLFLGLFGAEGTRTEGHVFIDGTEVSLPSPRAAIRKGLALLTNDRKASGLVLSMSVSANLCAVSLGSLSKLGWLRPRLESKLVAELGRSLRIKAASYDMEVGQLSGGNQQKVVIGKWLATEPRVIILDEPTKGIDVGSKAAVHAFMGELAAHGLAVIMVSSDLPEILGMSDRVVVMRQGRVAGTFDRLGLTAETLVRAATGNLGAQAA
jgi:rhamnose transport system ATP-binding protein